MIKQSLLVGCLLAIYFVSMAQNFSGTWRGEMVSNMSKPQRTFIFYLHLGQSGKVVWGVYSSGRNPKIDSVDCICRVNGQLDKKDLVVIKMYKDQLINNRISYQSCDFLNYLEFEYAKVGREEVLRGKWYGKASNNLRPDYAGGNIILRKINPKTIIDIEQYYPDLPLVIKKNNSVDSSFSETRH